jgi:hypothetical protein
MVSQVRGKTIEQVKRKSTKTLAEILELQQTLTVRAGEGLEFNSEIKSVLRLYPDQKELQKPTIQMTIAKSFRSKPCLGQPNPLQLAYFWGSE